LEVPRRNYQASRKAPICAARSGIFDSGEWRVGETIDVGERRSRRTSGPVRAWRLVGLYQPEVSTHEPGWPLARPGGIARHGWVAPKSSGCYKTPRSCRAIRHLRFWGVACGGNYRRWGAQVTADFRAGSCVEAWVGGPSPKSLRTNPAGRWRVQAGSRGTDEWARPWQLKC